MNDLGSVTEGHAVLTFERGLPFPIDRVWTAITDPGERQAWLGTTHIEDGEIVVEPDDPPAPPEAKRVTGRILIWQPPDDGDETALTFAHRGPSERNALGFVPGTHAFLDRLQAQLDGEELPGWSSATLRWRRPTLPGAERSHPLPDGRMPGFPAIAVGQRIHELDHSGHHVPEAVRHGERVRRCLEASHGWKCYQVRPI